MEIFIIPLIALAVWILHYIFQGEDESKPQPRPRQPAAGPRPVDRPRRPVSDLDRYLEETRRRRQDDGRPVVVAEVVPVAPPRAEEKPRAVVSPVRPAAPPRIERRPPPSAPELARRPPPAQPSLPSAMDVAPLPTNPIVRQEVTSLRTDAPPMAVEVLGGTRAPSPLLGELARMLGTPRSLAAAVILHEMLERPRWRGSPTS